MKQETLEPAEESFSRLATRQAGPRRWEELVQFERKDHCHVSAVGWISVVVIGVSLAGLRWARPGGGPRLRILSMARYDPVVLQVLADKTSAQATSAQLGGIAAGALSGGLFGYAGTLMFLTPFSLLIPGLVVGAVLGVLVGRRRALALRLQAQVALCQLQIEKNTARGPGI